MDIDGRIGRETTRLAALSGNDIDVELALPRGREHNPLTVRRPVRPGGVASTQVGQLDAVGSIRVGSPDLRYSRADGNESETASVGRQPTMELRLRR